MVDSRKDVDPLVDELPSRYVVGIDLGTTNSAVAYVDTHEKPWKPRIFRLPQLVAPGEVDARETLPSFHYEPARQEASGDALRLPWSTTNPTLAHVVGLFARDHGSKTPDRLIASAKSWLCHSGVDRTADVLPWHGAADVQRLSPVEVSARYLRHMHDAWNAQFPKERLADQDIVLTLPASFDEVARELTVEAASQAGLSRVVLVEEPQAAFYAWVHRHADDWQQRVAAGQKILVCDIGGGTSDFTLIRARQSSSDKAKIQFHRVAVGDHLILGGDNLDLALATHLEKKLTRGKKLETRQWDVLVRGCRRVKEDLLADDAPEKVTLNLPSSGSKLIGGGKQVEVTRKEVETVLIEGFLPKVSLDESPVQHQSGFQEFGLPFASDAAITRHLAHFLTSHAGGEEAEDGRNEDPSARPDVVLFNGGFFASSKLRNRLTDVLCSWFTEKGKGKKRWSPVVLKNDRLDLAVARGAAYYGMVRRGEGVKITAALARSYYIGVAGEQPSAVCLVPGNAEAGDDFAVSNRGYELTISEPVEFPLYVSSTRVADQPGDLIAVDAEQLKSMPPIRTVIRAKSRNEKGNVPISLHAKLTEIGTVDLWCGEIGSERSWRLQFDVRSATQTDMAATESTGDVEGALDEQSVETCYGIIEDVFAKGGKGKPEGLVKRLAKELGIHRDRWPMSLLRRTWEFLMEFESGRRRSIAHESRWLNLLGYALRPGYGMAVDDWRVTETWRIVQGKLAHHSAAIRAESLILWRRIGGGLSAGQQRSIAEPLVASVRTMHRQSTTGKSRSGDVGVKPSETAEIWHLLGSLELLGVPQKVDLGTKLLDLLPKKKFEPARPAMIWAVGRLGQRVPVYGPLNTVVPPQTASAWLEALTQLETDLPVHDLAIMQLARRTADRYRDLDEKARQRAADWLADREVSPHLIELVRDGGQLDEQERNRVFGEKLPSGIRIR